MITFVLLKFKKNGNYHVLGISFCTVTKIYVRNTCIDVSILQEALVSGRYFIQLSFFHYFVFLSQIQTLSQFSNTIDILFFQVTILYIYSKYLS